MTTSTANQETSLSTTVAPTPVLTEPSPSTKRWALLQKFHKLRDELNTEILESSERINGALIALVAGEHMAMVGAPGVAKTYLVDRLVGRITGVNYYAETMKKMMPPEEAIGPVSITRLKNDEWHRVTTGMLPEADVALVDEFTRTSDGILNSLLEMLNERRFKNGATKAPVPLSTAFLCSNSFPTGESEHDLEAFWDRVVMRFIVEAPVEQATWRAIARMRHTEFPAPVLSWEDVLEAKAQARALPFAEDTWDAIDEIRRNLVEVGITMSPRRCRQAQFVAAAWAWLEGADEVLPEHCVPLMHMLWDEPTQCRQVEREVTAVVAPGVRAALAIGDAVQELVDAVQTVLAMEPSERAPQLNELQFKNKAQKSEINAFLATAIGKAAEIVQLADAQLLAAQLRLLKEGFNLDFEDIAGLAEMGA